MTYCETCGHQFSDVCGGCETLEGVHVKYTPKTSETIYCKDCKFRTESNLPYPSFYCTHFNCHCELLGCDEGERKTKTNADRIRAMSDEELADFLEKVADGCDSCPMLKECTYSDGEMSEEQVRLIWLKQEVSDDS